MGTSPGMSFHTPIGQFYRQDCRRLAARNPDCARAQVLRRTWYVGMVDRNRGARVVDDEIRILIADDHPLMRKGLRLSVEEDPGLKVVGEAADGEAALLSIKKLHPHIALLDIEMPNLGGPGGAGDVVKGGRK